MVDISKIYKVPEWDPFPAPDPEKTEHCALNIWAIKHPTLRGYRLKVIYKDVFSNERRFRFGMCDSPLCQCGNIETIGHQLLQCNNAHRMWLLYKDITGCEITNLKDVISCSSNIPNEIIKSVIIKRLVQIDRSLNFPNRAIIAECLLFLQIESVAHKSIDNRRNYDTLISSLKRLLS